MAIEDGAGTRNKLDQKLKSKSNSSKVKKIADLQGTDAEYNPRHADVDALKRLNKTMAAFGDLGGIVLNVRTNTLVGGHQRKKVLDPTWEIYKEPLTDTTGTVAEGYVQTPYGRFKYREVDWDLETEMAANLAANKGAGEWVFERRNDILEKLDTGRFDMELTGHSLDEMENMFNWTPGSLPWESGNQVSLNDIKKDFKPREEHKKLKEYKEAPEAVDTRQMIVVKINIDMEMVLWLDEFYKSMGLNSRSEAVRYLIREHRGEL